MYCTGMIMIWILVMNRELMITQVNDRRSVDSLELSKIKGIVKNESDSIQNQLNDMNGKKQVADLRE